MIVVPHEMAFARDVGSRVFLSQGVIAEEGDSKEVLAKPQSERTFPPSAILRASPRSP